MLLNGRRVLLTGASRGIGAALARAFAEHLVLSRAVAGEPRRDG